MSRRQQELQVGSKSRSTSLTLSLSGCDCDCDCGWMLRRRLHIINLLRQPHSLGLHQLLCVQNVLPFPGTVPVPDFFSCSLSPPAACLLLLPAFSCFLPPPAPCLLLSKSCRRMLATFLSYAVPCQVAKLPSCRVARVARVAMLWSSTVVDFLCCICLARHSLLSLHFVINAHLSFSFLPFWLPLLRLLLLLRSLYSACCEPALCAPSN